MKILALIPAFALVGCATQTRTSAVYEDAPLVQSSCAPAPQRVVVRSDPCAPAPQAVVVRQASPCVQAAPVGCYTNARGEMVCGVPQGQIVAYRTETSMRLSRQGKQAVMIPPNLFLCAGGFARCVWETVLEPILPDDDGTQSAAQRYAAGGCR